MKKLKLFLLLFGVSVTLSSCGMGESKAQKSEYESAQTVLQQAEEENSELKSKMETMPEPTEPETENPIREMTETITVGDWTIALAGMAISETVDEDGCKEVYLRASVTNNDTEKERELLSMSEDGDIQMDLVYQLYYRYEMDVADTFADEKFIETTWGITSEDEFQDFEKYAAGETKDMVFYGNIPEEVLNSGEELLLKVYPAHENEEKPVYVKINR